MELGDAILEIYPKLLAIALARTGSRSDADDLVQNACVRAFEKKSQFQGGSLEAWMVTIMRNINIDQSRSAWNRYRSPIDIEDIDFVDKITADRPEDAVFLSEVVSALSELGGTCREILLLYAQGYKNREIAECLSKPLGTVLRSMSECRNSLHEFLNKNAT